MLIRKKIVLGFFKKSLKKDLDFFNPKFIFLKMKQTHQLLARYIYSNIWSNVFIYLQSNFCIDPISNQFYLITHINDKN